MAKARKNYLTPVTSLLKQCHIPLFCKGSNGAKFLNNEGTLGNLKAIESNGDADLAASRRFDDEETEADW